METRSRFTGHSLVVYGQDSGHVKRDVQKLEEAYGWAASSRAGKAEKDKGAESLEARILPLLFSRTS